jgi:bifunctional enzyme CysN/CysC
VITAFISPYESDRQNARSIIGEDSFIEVYVNTPLEECEKRDVKGLYKRAREHQIPNFTGITSPYEIPQSPDITVRTDSMSVEECVNEIIKKLDLNR